MSYTVDAIFGFIGIGMVSVMIAYLSLIQRNFRERRKVALTMFFLRDKGAKHFKILAFSMIVYAASMFAVGIEMIYPSFWLEVLSRTAILVTMGGLIYFVHGVEHITAQRENEEEEG